MILEVSKYRLWYKKRPCKGCSPTYITQRTLFLEDIDAAICSAEETMAHLGTKMHEEKAYGYKCYDSKKHIEIGILTRYLRKYKRQVMWGGEGVKPCFTDRQLQEAIERVKGLSIMNCCTGCKSSLTIDDTQRDEWNENNPWCVSREKWERLAHQVCDDLKLKVTSTEVACDLAYTITSEEVDCTLAYAIESYRKDCKIEFDVTEDTWKKSGCKTPYDECKKLSTCGISFDMISDLDKCGIEVRYDQLEKCPTIKYEGKITSMKDIDILKDFDFDKVCTRKTYFSDN